MLARILVSLGALCLPFIAVADLVVYDHFDDRQLDPAWEVTLNDINCGWTYTEELSALHVTEICHDGPASEWATVSLSRPCPAPADFSLSWRIAWDTHLIVGAMQVLYLRLNDEAGDWIVLGGFRDAWEIYTGEKVALIGDDDSYYSGLGSLLQVGTAAIRITRHAGMITWKWDDEVVLEAPSSTPVASITITFYTTWYTYTPGINASMDLIRVADYAIVGAPDIVAGHGPRLTGIRPNPFNPRTSIAFTLDRPQSATIAVYDLSGRLVEVLGDQTYDAGEHAVDWSGIDSAGRAVPSGTYVIRLEADAGTQARKALLLR